MIIQSVIRRTVLILATLCFGSVAGAETQFDLILHGGTVYDGSGSPPVVADVGVRGDRVVQVGNLANAKAKKRVEVKGLAVAPGFINSLSWAPEALIADGRSQSDIRQGVTLEIFGEGFSMGPLNEEMRKTTSILGQVDIAYKPEWTTLGEYLDWAVAKGTSTNIASLIGAMTVRIHELGYADAQPTPAQMERMKGLVRKAMEEGALGVGSALIYVPGSFSRTEELIELAKAAAEYGGIYSSHMRSEADRLLEAIDETIRISREAGTHAEIYHLKAAGERNWPKMREAIARIENARKNGVDIAANMYPYTAAATGLYAGMPPWVQEGGLDAWIDRLRQPEVRQRVAREMRAPGADWENLYEATGSPDRVLLIGLINPKLKPFTGKSIAAVAALRGQTPEETAMDLIIEDHSRVEVAYFLMSEENVKLGLSQPWVSIGSDERSLAPEGVFLRRSNHPRAYGSFARLLGHYARDEKLMTLQEAVRRVTRLPAQNFRIRDRGCLDKGCFADLVVFDPDKIGDRATFDNADRYATGMVHVFVNGQQVLKDGEHTGAKPGQVVRGQGYRAKYGNRAR